ncbi:hypothetical protein [Dolosigranulum pigrum]|jgi:hypothetical protein|uniref:hypothetical protein n=1 Tax=Dolosigranulum pigrum TaxID=29394 RepID=UPI001AD87B7E|nr:hypothetical protein [Dolosigranulum pigrum]QTJ56812.1 hypothetical protein FE335_04540 [Dolosigranulum pigrum]
MKKVHVGKYTLSNSDQVVAFYDEKQSRITYLTEIYDEVHLVIDIMRDELIFYPRYNVQIEQLDEHHFYIDVASNPDVPPSLNWLK